VSSPAAISLFSLVYSPQPVPLWGRHDPTCNYPFPIPTRLLASWSGRNPPCHGYSRQNNGEYHSPLPDNYPCGNFGHRYRPLTRSYPPPYSQRMLAMPYPRIHALLHCLPTPHSPQNHRIEHTPPTYPLHIKHPHSPRQKQSIQPLSRNDHADALANQVVDGHHPDTIYTTGFEVSIGTWTCPYILIPQTQGEPTPFRYTNLKIDAHKYNIKHTHSPFSRTTKCSALLARAISNGVDFSVHKPHTTLANIQFTHNQEFMWGVHNTRLLPHNPTLRCPMCRQFTITGHMA
jgi:hypothetical protein